MPYKRSKKEAPIPAPKKVLIKIIHAPLWAAHDSPEMPFPWADGPEREILLDEFHRRTSRDHGRLERL